MTTVSLGVKDTLAKMLDAVPAKKRQFLHARVTQIPAEIEVNCITTQSTHIVIVDGTYVASKKRTMKVRLSSEGQ